MTNDEVKVIKLIKDYIAPTVIDLNDISSYTHIDQKRLNNILSSLIKKGYVIDESYTFIDRENNCSTTEYFTYSGTLKCNQFLEEKRKRTILKLAGFIVSVATLLVGIIELLK
jgi:hypothetical protein